MLMEKTKPGGDGFIVRGKKREFPIGIYELPEADSDLKEISKAGINLIRCHDTGDLDRAQKYGLVGWVPLPLHEGLSSDLGNSIETVKDHPALAVWEGPDEIVWRFTASSKLKKKAGIDRSDWWNQRQRALEYAREQGQKIMPKLRKSIQFLRENDRENHQIWFNEAASSDAKFSRMYMDYIDITGCDCYPVPKRPPAEVGASVERWKAIGRGKPVWMVLQGCARGEWNDDFDEEQITYPTFQQSRFMAYDALAHGASGILYWGTHHLRSAISAQYRQSLYTLISELSSLQPFLKRSPATGLSLKLMDRPQKRPTSSSWIGLTARCYRLGNEWLILLVNDRDMFHSGVQIGGLDLLDGCKLELLYGDEEVLVTRGEIVTRMKPYQAKVFCTDRKYESSFREGRDFGLK